jgi:hypothetical protein
MIFRHPRLRSASAAGNPREAYRTCRERYEVSQLLQRDFQDLN